MAKQSNLDNENKRPVYYKFPSVLLRKLKFIVLQEQTTQANIVETLLTEYVAKWEKKNGLVPLK